MCHSYTFAVPELYLGGNNLKASGKIYCAYNTDTLLTDSVCYHCSQDGPTMEEKVDMAQSIVKTFPVLKVPVTGGYVSRVISSYT